MTRWTSALVVIAAFMTLGCQRRIAEEPPQIRYGQHACAECRMLINEERFAAAVDTTDGTVAFDAVECLVRWLADGGTARRVWVHDYDSSAWLAGRTAWFVRSRELATPMGAGLVALATEQAARELGSRIQGDVLRFEELPRIIQTREAIRSS